MPVDINLRSDLRSESDMRRSVGTDLKPYHSPHKRLPKDPNDTSGAALSPFVTNTALLIKDISYGFKSQ